MDSDICEHILETVHDPPEMPCDASSSGLCNAEIENMDTSDNDSESGRQCVLTVFEYDAWLLNYCSNADSLVNCEQPFYI